MAQSPLRGLRHGRLRATVADIAFIKRSVKVGGMHSSTQGGTVNSLSDLLSQLRLPVFGSPMFIASGPELVKAQCQAGVVGSFPSLNARPASMLTDWLDEITESNAAFTSANPERPAAPFAVNLIVHRSNNRLEADLAEVVRHQVPIVITSLGAREGVNEAVHSYAGIVLHDGINTRITHKAIENHAAGHTARVEAAVAPARPHPPFCRRMRPMSSTTTVGWSSSRAASTSSTRATSPASRATICAARSSPRASTRTICPRPIRRRWTSAPTRIRRRRPGATSGARVRASG